ncbi:MAG: Gldg family protein [Clostridia bacterium]|nr:Gldg family protein [Clostridia bacterium]
MSKKQVASEPIQKTQRDPRRRRFRTISTALTMAVIVGIILLNGIVSIIADRFPITFDMSSDKVFTLSEESKNVAKAVTNEVEVVIFADIEDYFIQMAQGLYEMSLTYYGVEIDLSNQLERLSREIETALAQLKSNSGEKITYTFINPDQEPEKYAQYTKYNMGDNNVLFISGERNRKTSLQNMCEITDVNTVTSNVEKVLVSNIYALQGEDDRVIQVLTGHEENNTTIAALKKLYELNGYIFEELLITGSAEFNDKAETLLIAAPAKDYSEAEIQRIRTWLKNDNKRNRHMMVYINPTADCPNLYEMLKTDYHIEVTNQLIYESDPNRYYDYDNRLISADVPTNDYTTNSAGTATVVMPMTRRLLCDLPATSEGIGELGIPLTTHPDTAWVSTIGSDSGKLTLDESDYPLHSTIAYVYESFDDNTQESATTTVTVCGSASMPEYAQTSSVKNEDFLLDMIHKITGYETNISISNKIIAKDVTEFKTGTQMVLGIWVFTVGLPVVVLAICLVIFLRRRSL